MIRLNRRVLILIFLAVATVLYRAPGTHMSFFSSSIAGGTGIEFEIDDGAMQVKSVRQTDSLERPTPAHLAGIKPGDTILEVWSARGEGGPIRSLSDYGRVQREIQYGEKWAIVVGRNDGAVTKQIRFEMPPVERPGADSALYRVILFQIVAIPLIAILTAFFVGFARPDDSNAFLGALLFLSFSVLFGVYIMVYPPVLRELAIAYFTLGQAFSTYLLMRFFLLFPSRSPIERRLPWLKSVFFWLTGAVAAMTLYGAYPAYYSFELAERLGGFLEPIEPALGTVWGYANLAMVAIAMVSLVMNAVKAPTRDERRRLVILLVGLMASILPVITLVIYREVMKNTVTIGWIVVIAASLAVFPLTFGYVVVKDRVFGIKVILRRGLQYALLSRGFRLVQIALIFLIIYFGVQSAATTIFVGAGIGLVSTSTTLLTVGAVVGLRKVSEPVMRAIDRRFFREAYDARQILSSLSRAVRDLAAKPEQLTELVAEQISRSLHPNHVALFLRPEPASDDPPSADFKCVRFLQRLDGDGGRISVSPGDLSQLTMPAGALIPRHLAASQRHETIEIYPDRPRATTSALVPAAAQADLLAETDLVYRLGTRLVVPLRTASGLIGFMSLGEKLSEEPYSREDKEMLLTVAEQMSIALDYAQLVRRVAEQEKLNRELEIAKDVQVRLFPQVHPQMRTLEYSAACHAARGVAGDYYDFLLVGDGRLGLAIGDVSGKGIGAALLMASLQAFLRSNAPHRGEQVQQLLADINRLMSDNTDHNKYATFFYALYDDASRALTYVNAGHNPPMLFRPTPGQDAPAELLRLDRGGLAVGMFPVVAYEQETVHLKTGDILVLYTDGVSEAMNTAQDEFGEERIEHVVRRAAGLSAAEIRDQVLLELTGFVGDAPQYDDVTLVVARVV